MPRIARTIAGVALRLWVREIASVLAVPVARVVGGLVVAGVCALAMGALLALAASSNLPDELPNELRAAVLGTSFAGAALTAGAIAVALCAAAPSRTALANLLTLLPVGPVAARLGQLSPTLVLGLAYTLALSSTASVVVVRTATGSGAAVFGLGAQLSLVVTMLALSTALFSLVDTFAVRVVRLPQAYASALAGTVSLGAVFTATLPTVLLPPPAPGTDLAQAALLPHRAFAAVAAAPSALGWLAPLAWVVAALALLVLAARVHRAAGPPRRLVLPRSTRPLRSTPWWGLLWKELLELVRTPQFALVVLVLPLAVTGVALLAALPFAAPLVPSLASAVVLLPALLALQVPGRTQPSEWATDLVTARPALRLAPPFVAVAVVAAALATPTLAALMLLGLVEPPAVGGILLRGVLAIALALACGAVVPWSEQQPLSATAGGLLLALASMLLALGVSGAITVAGPAVEAPVLAIATLLAAGVYVGARQRTGRTHAR